MMTTTTPAQIHTCELNWSFSCQQQFECRCYYATSLEFFVVGSPIKWRLGLEYVCEDDQVYPNEEGEMECDIIWCLKLAAASYCDAGKADDDCTIAGATTVEVIHRNGDTSELKRNFERKRNEIKTNCYSEVCDYGGILISPTSDVTITCTVNFFKLSDMIPFIVSTHQRVRHSSNMGTSHLAAGLEDMYLNEKHSDVTLQINDNRYPAHKIILGGCSEVFATMFGQDMTENNQNLVEIKGIGEQVFLEALRYMYTGKVTNADTLAYDLLPLADRYDIRGLKIFCEDILNKQLSVETIVKMLMLADSCNAENLKALAFKFILKRSKSVAKQISAEDWQTLLSRPTLNKDLMVLLMEK